MTVCIGLHLGPYVMLVSDTRITYFPPDKPTFFKDETKKLQRTAMGLITGSGFGTLLDDVKKRITDTEVLHTDQVLDIILEERESIEQSHWMTFDRVRESLEHTCWLMTYVTADSPETLTPTSVKMRLVLSHPQNDYHFAVYEPGGGILTFPTGSTAEQMSEFNERLDSGIRVLDNETDFAKNLTHHIALAGRVVHDLSLVNDSVSKSFQFGIQMLGKVGVSQVIDPDNFPDEIEIDWSG